MKKLLTILIAAFAFSTAAFADDELSLPRDSANTPKVCYWFTRIAGHGMLMRHMGRKNVVEFYTKDDANKNEENNATDYSTMAVLDDGQYSPEEKQLIILALTEGWLVGDKFKQAFGEEVDYPPFGKFAEGINTTCEAIKWTAPLSEQKLP